ncbi:MAG: hypothetical protein AB9907_06565 [Flexilinea sp.]
MDKKIKFTHGTLENGRGDEDAACADYIEGFMTGQMIPHEVVINRVRNSKNGLRFKRELSKDIPEEDLDFVCDIDRFNSVMVAERLNNRLVRLTNQIKE